MLTDGEADIGIATEALASSAELAAFSYYSWSHAVVVPAGHALAGHALEGAGKVTLEALAKWPIVTYDEGFTGRQRIDEAFAASGVLPDIVMVARDSDVIKTYVELGLGVGIIASMAFSADRDAGLVMLEAEHLFGRTTSHIAVRRGRLLRGYTYRFIELCVPTLTENVVRGAQAASPARTATELLQLSFTTEGHVPVPWSVSLLERQTNMRPCMAN